MCDDHGQKAGLTGIVFLGALALGASGVTARADEFPVQTAVHQVPQLQTDSTVSVERSPANGSEVVPENTVGGCDGIIVRATELVFSDSFETGDTSFWGPGALTRFSASRMLDLELAVRFTKEIAGDHLVRLKLLTPKGHHYQTLSIPITSNAKRQGGRRRVEGYPRPVAVRVLRKADSSSLPEVTFSVPVGGTPIVTSSIFGVWTAEAYLDDNSEVCFSQAFILTP